MLTLGDRIRHIRSKILRFNQAVFADNLGFSRIATISDYEKNKRNPDIIALRKMASLANVTIEWLLTGNGPIFMPGTKDSKEYSCRGRKIVKRREAPPIPLTSWMSRSTT
ncbi:MAG: helix-turn-helix transcriptional regulator [Deltaproteobacteria bacterium]|nr:helix-turn-helix transcriptional regulator [Deltaproteobacteria bacterium]